MKNYFLTVLFLDITIAINAQNTPTQDYRTKHRWTVSLEYQNLIELSRQSNFNVSDKPIRQFVPTVGYYVGKQTVVGLGLAVGYQSINGTYYGIVPNVPGPAHASYYRTKEVGLAPYIQRFIGTGRVRPFVGVSATFLQRRLTYAVPDVPTNIVSNELQVIPSVFAGFTYFICPKLGIDAVVRYKHERSSYHGVQSLIYGGLIDFSVNEQEVYSANVGVRYILGR